MCCAVNLYFLASLLQEEGEEEEQEAGFTGSDVMPTEEQLPGMQQSKPKRSALLVDLPRSKKM